METCYRIIKSVKQLEDLIQWCKDTGVVSVDFETTGHPVYTDEFKPTILGVSFQPGSGWIIPLGHYDSPFKDWKRILKIFSKGVIENPAILKIAWNLEFEYSIFLKYGYRMRGRIFDGMIAKYLLDETRPNDLKSQVEKYLPDFADYELPNTPSPKSKRENIVKFWSNVNLEELSEYCAADADFTLRLMLHFEPKLMKEGVYPLFRSFYMPLIRIFAKNKLRGIRVDLDYLNFLDEFFHSKLVELERDLRNNPIVKNFEETAIEDRIQDYLEKLEEEIENGNLSERQIASREEKISRIEAGEATTQKEAKLFEPINFASPKQLADLLYLSEYGFEFPILERSDAGAPSTSEPTLLKLVPRDDSGFIKGLLELRGLSKMYTTYIKNIIEEQVYKDRLHPSFLLHGTVTGRLSSRGPNFQNIPRSTTDSYIKKYILPDKPGQVIVETDASQAELRTVASLANDPDMKRIFKEGRNIHAATAALITGEDYNLINKARKDESHERHIWAIKEHKKAKVTNFGIIYGMSKFALSERLTMDTGVRHSHDDGQEMIDNWFGAYPKTRAYIKKTQKLAETKGYVVSPIGRRRRLPILLNPRNKVFRKSEYNEALRQAVNGPIQGFASDITQWANINIYEAALRGEIPDYILMYITVHDSLEYSINIEDIDKVVPKIQEIAASMKDMEKYLGGSLTGVEMKFSAEAGITWGHAHEYFPGKDYKEIFKKDIEEFNKHRIENNVKPFFHEIT